MVGRGRPLQSAIWKSFKILDHERRMARCQRCRGIFSFVGTVSNLRKHLDRCLTRPSRFVAPSPKPALGERSRAASADSESRSKQTPPPGLLEGEVSADGDPADASRDRLDVSEEKAWSFFSRAEGGAAAECRLCCEPVSCEGPSLVGHLLAFHADTPLEGPAQEENNVVIETLYLDADERIPKSTPKTNRAKRKYTRVEDIEQDIEEAPVDGCLETFVGYLTSLLKELPLEKSRRLQLDFIAQVYKARLELSRPNGKRRNSNSSSDFSP